MTDMTFPPPTLTPTPTLPEPAKGFAVTAFVCGIVGAIFGLIPILALLALPLGIIAVVFGLLGARRNKRAKAGVGLARAGWLLGVTAVILAVIGFVIVNNAIDDFQDDMDQLEQDLEG